jgi:hypothetical protein
MKDYLELIALIVGIATPVLGGLWFLWRARTSSIQDNRKTLAQTWTNEGSIGSNESMFIDLILELNSGDLYGSITSPQLDRDYNVNVNTGWFSSKLVIGESFGRGTLVKATVKVKISGNRNRLVWKPLNVPSRYKLPSKTVLCPYT